MTKEQLIQLLINNLPAIVGVLGMLFTIFKGISMIKNIFEKSDVRNIEDKMIIMIQENYNLQKQIADNTKENAELRKELAEVLEKVVEDKPKEV